MRSALISGYSCLQQRSCVRHWATLVCTSHHLAQVAAFSSGWVSNVDKDFEIDLWNPLNFMALVDSCPLLSICLGGRELHVKHSKMIWSGGLVKIFWAPPECPKRDQPWIKHANAEELLRHAQQHGLAAAILDELDRERQELRCSVAETQSCLVRKASWSSQTVGAILHCNGWLGNLEHFFLTLCTAT